MTTIRSSGSALSSELMMAMDQLSRDMRRDHREQSIHEANEALMQSLDEAGSLRDQASSTFTGAVISGSLTVLGGGAQVTSAAGMQVGPLDTPKPAATEAPGMGAAATTGTAASSTGTTVTTDTPSSAASSVAGGKAAESTVTGEASKLNSPREVPASTTEAQTPQGDERARMDALARREGANKLWNVLGVAGRSAAESAGPAQKIFDSRADAHGANAAEHRGRSQAASRRADAEQSDAQEAQKMSDKARELHQQILGLDHASRMAVLRG